MTLYQLRQLAESPTSKAIVSQFRTELDTLVDLAIKIQQIPSPTFQEEERAKYVNRAFQKFGLHSVSIDPIFNVYGRLPGRDQTQPPVIVSAHTDTVFPAETDLSVRRESNRVFGPSIADNSMGVASLLWLIKTYIAQKLGHERDIWFVANVGEEGLGDLCGMRAVCDRFGPAATYIVIEGGSFGHIIHRGIGVSRFKVSVTAQGGHSWADFGRSSAIHSLGRIIADISRLKVPSTPKTTYNVGVIEGGTSINTVAPTASLLLDLRSESETVLNQLKLQVDQIIVKHDRDMNIDIQMEQIGNRPVGGVERNHPLVMLAAETLALSGAKQVEFGGSSTDANIPLSIGADAVCIGIGESGNVHRTDEFLNIKQVPKGMSQLFLLTHHLAKPVQH